MTRRGSVLVVTLLLNVCFALLVFGLLQKSRDRYRGSNSLMQSEKARALAWAGLEDARLKLGQDPVFPPPWGTEQDTFSYMEEVKDVDNSTVAGHFVVEFEVEHYTDTLVYRIHSTGLVGPPEHPYASVSIVQDVDQSPTVRGSAPAVPNPQLGQPVQGRDESGW